MIKFCVITLFPEMFNQFTQLGIIGDAFNSNKVAITFINPRDFTTDVHKTVDDTPYGGGPGMVLKPEPLAMAIDQAKDRLPQAKVYYLSPQGKILTDATVRELATSESAMILLCGRYLGIDQRIIDSRVDEEISIGNYIVSGGEIPAQILIDAICRNVPEVLGSAESINAESFANDKLAPPCYTRPVEFEGQVVPEVLRSGDHQAIANWRDEQADIKTKKWLKDNDNSATLA